jgi:hypothetical protein
MKTLTLVLALALGAVACSGAPNVPSSTAQAAKAKAPLAVVVSGPLRTVADAFADVPLRPEQRASIEHELKQAEDRHAKLKPLGKAVILLVADQIERGAMDEAAIQPKVDAIALALKPMRDEDRKAIQRVHDLLDGDQRIALVDALDAKHHERFGKERGFRKIAEELDLSMEQKANIFQAVRGDTGAHEGNWAEMKEHRQKAMESFKTDQFQIDQAAPAMDLDKDSKQMFERGVRFARAALPILTPEQRGTAARILREKADTLGDMVH